MSASINARFSRRSGSADMISNDELADAVAAASKPIPLHKLLGYEEAEAPAGLKRIVSLLDALDRKRQEQDWSRQTLSGSLGGVVTALDGPAKVNHWSNLRGFGIRGGGSAFGRLRVRRQLSGSFDKSEQGVLSTAVGLQLAKQHLQSFFAELERQVAAGLCTGAQVAVRVHAAGSPGGTAEGAPSWSAMDFALGEARPGVPMRNDMLAYWMSTTKPIAVIAIAQLYERGLIALDKPVATYMPAFAQNGKADVLVEHLLTHTSGFPFADLEHWSNLHAWGAIVATIQAARLAEGWVPGQRCGYHAYSAWFVLGELVRLLDGRPFAQYVREAIFAPLGAMADSHVGMSSDAYAAYKKGGRIAELRSSLPNGKPNLRAPDGSSHNEVTACVPAANGRAPAAEWVRVYEMLLLDGVGANGVRLLQAETVRLFTARYRVGMLDEVTRSTCDWSLGCFVGAKICGAHASPNVFGHGGSQSSIAFCDPDARLTCCLFLNNRPGAQQHEKRLERLCTLLYEDLQRAGAIKGAEKVADRV